MHTTDCVKYIENRLIKSNLNATYTMIGMPKKKKQNKANETIK